MIKEQCRDFFIGIFNITKRIHKLERKNTPGEVEVKSERGWAVDAVAKDQRQPDPQARQENNQVSS